MALLTRQQVIEHIETAGGGPASLARWAFDQFYAEEEGTIEFEPGYRHAIGAVLDELMFADEPRFALSEEALQALVGRLRAARPGSDDEDGDDETIG